MAVYQEDLKIFQSQNMNDEPEGGGRQSDKVIKTGVSNEIFDDVSDLNTVTGNVSMRKVFFNPATDNADKLMASRVVFTDLPSNPNVSVFAFEPVHENDSRKEAKDRMEQYLAYGTKWAGHLLENQLKGQKVIELSLDKEGRVPAVGSVIVLIQNALDEDKFHQYIKINKVSTEIRRFPLRADKTVERKIATIEITQPLKFTFKGLTVAEYMEGVSDQRKAIVRDSRVADASKYYSAVALESEANVGERQLNLESVYVQIVPSTQTAIPLPRLNAMNESKFLIRSSNNTTKITHKSVHINPTTAFNLGSAIYPGTLKLSLLHASNPTQVFSDKNGEIIEKEGDAWGSITYETGIIKWYKKLLNHQDIEVEYLPAIQTSRVNRTVAEIVPEDGAGLSYLRTLPEQPASGTLTVSYQVDGNVYTLIDKGSGELISLDGTGGVGSITDRTVKWTAGAIPDSGSIIVYSYGEHSNTYTYQSKTLKFVVVIPLPNTSNIIKDGLELSWGIDKTAVSNNVGVLSGDVNGQVYIDKLVLYFDKLPEKSTKFTLSYKRGTAISVDNTECTKKNIVEEGVVKKGVEIQINGTSPILKGSMLCKVPMDGKEVLLKDDGDGNMIFYKGFAKLKRRGVMKTCNHKGDIIGTIDYANRKLILNKLKFEQLWKVLYREHESMELGSA